MIRPTFHIALGFLLLLAAAPKFASAQTATQTFADAEYVTPQQFLNMLQDVSITINAPRQVTRYVPELEIQADVQDALSVYNIGVRADSSVRLVVTVVEKLSNFYFNDDKSDTQDAHDVLITLDFTTRGVVRRGDKFVALLAAPVKADRMTTFFQNNSDRRLFFGDETEKDYKELIPDLLKAALADVAANDARDDTPWYASSWTAGQKAAANTQFQSLMRGPISAADRFAGLTVMPTISTSSAGEDDCKLPKYYLDAWRRAFTSLGWTQSSTETPMLFEHFFECDWIDTYNAPKYSRLWNSITVKEPNFVFMLNGKIMRKPAVIQWWNRLDALDRNDPLSDAFDKFVDDIEYQSDTLKVPKTATAPAAPAKPPAR